MITETIPKLLPEPSHPEPITPPRMGPVDARREFIFWVMTIDRKRTFDIHASNGFMQELLNK